MSTRDRLLEAVPVVLAREGIAGTSARVLADQAGVNQALIFYHYGSVDGLLAEAARTISKSRAETYATRDSPGSTASPASPPRPAVCTTRNRPPATSPCSPSY